MKVLHLIKTHIGARWAAWQIKVLREMGVEVVVALPEVEGGITDEYRKVGAELIQCDLNLPLKKPHRLPAVLERCRQLVDQVKPDQVLHEINCVKI